MNIDELTIGEARKLASMFHSTPGVPSPPTNSLSVGVAVLIRTVTHYYTGRILSVTDWDIVLGDAAWIADTGRWHDALKTGVVNECEPFIDTVIISRGAIVDVTTWNHALPRVQK